MPCSSFGIEWLFTYHQETVLLRENALCVAYSVHGTRQHPEGFLGSCSWLYVTVHTVLNWHEHPEGQLCNCHGNCDFRHHCVVVSLAAGGLRIWRQNAGHSAVHFSNREYGVAHHLLGNYCENKPKLFGVKMEWNATRPFILIMIITRLSSYAGHQLSHMLQSC